MKYTLALVCDGRKVMFAVNGNVAGEYCEKYGFSNLCGFVKKVYLDFCNEADACDVAYALGEIIEELEEGEEPDFGSREFAELVADRAENLR